MEIASDSQVVARLKLISVASETAFDEGEQITWGDSEPRPANVVCAPKSEWLR